MLKRLTWLLVGLGYLALSGLILWYMAHASADFGLARWLASSVASCTLLFFAALVLTAVCSHRERRAACVVGAILMALYWLAVFSSWLGPGVGSKLLTTRALTALEQSLRPTKTSSNVSGVVFVPSVGFVATEFPSTGRGDVTAPWNFHGWQAVSGPRWFNHPGYPVPTPSPVALSFPLFQVTGHYLLLWPLVLIAMWLAAFLYRRGRGREEPAPAALCHAGPHSSTSSVR